MMTLTLCACVALRYIQGFVLLIHASCNYVHRSNNEHSFLIDTADVMQQCSAKCVPTAALNHVGLKCMSQCLRFDRDDFCFEMRWDEIREGRKTI